MGKFELVMKEYKRGQLKSGSGRRVRKRSQALAIAYNLSPKKRRAKKK